MRPAITRRPEPVSEALRSTRGDFGLQVSEPKDAKKACRLLLCVGADKKDRGVAAGLAGPSGARTGGLAVKGQLPRNGRCPGGSLEWLGGMTEAVCLQKAIADSAPDLAPAMSSGAVDKFCLTLAVRDGLANSCFRLRRGFCAARRVNKAIPM